MSTQAAPPPSPAGSARIPEAEQRRGLVVLAVAFVLFTLLAGGVRAANAPRPVGDAAPAPVVTPTYVRGPKAPPEAKKTLWSTNQAASGQFVPNVYTAKPRIKATKTNPYRVLVETSLRYDPDGVARTVQFVLDDHRGWASYGKNNFELVTTDAENQLTFYLATPATTDQLCGAATTQGRWSCVVGNKIVLNSDRWFYTTPTIPGVDDYRAYLINHLTGRWLKQKVATKCPGQGAKAPVMLDQNTDLGGCKANSWPQTGA